MNENNDTTNNTIQEPVYEDGKYKCPNCGSELNNNELTSGRCFNCNTYFEPNINTISNTDIVADKTDKSFNRNRLLLLGVIVIFLIFVAIKFIADPENNSSSICAIDGCRNKSVYGSIYCEEHRGEMKDDIPVISESSEGTYSDDVITLTYNPDSTTVQKLDAPGMSYSLVVLNSGKAFDDTSLYNNSLVYIAEIDTPEGTFEYYNSSSLDAFKVLFVALANSSLTTEELAVNDVVGDTSGQLTTLIRCEKSLSDGRKVKAKLLHIDENKMLVTFYSMLPDEDQSIVDEFTAVYNSIRYNGNISVVTTETTTETTTIPVVSYADIKNGTYNNQTIKIEGILGNINVDSVSVSLDTWFNNNGKLNYNEFLLVTNNDTDLCNYITNNIEPGNSCIFTVNVYEDATVGTSFGSLVGIQKLDNALVTAEEIKQLYISGCTKITAAELARNPEQYAYKTDVALSGTVFQIVDENDNSVQFFLDTDGDNGLVNVYYDRPEGASRILEDDNITIYGTFTHMYDYTSVLGSGKSIPSIRCRFIN